MANYEILHDPDMQDILDSFIVETREILENLDSELMELESSPQDDELLNKIFRAFHTIKGTSGFLGLERLTLVTHKCEDILNKLRKGEAVLNSGIMDGILDAFDKIKLLSECVDENKNEDVEIDDTLNLLVSIIEGMENPSAAEVKKEKPVTAPEPDLKETAKAPKPNKKAAATRNKVTKKTATRKTPKKKTDDAFVEEPEPEEIEVEEVELDEVETEDDTVEVLEEDGEETPEIQEIPLESVGIIAKSKGTSGSGNVGDKIAKAAMQKSQESNIRVDIERLDELLNIASELVLGRNRLAQVNSDVALEHEGTELSRDLADVTKQIDLMTDELQLIVMKTRMVKIGKVFNRFPRVVRDLAKETQKEVRLIIKGEETELDKTLIEEINDPLVHLVRNSVDHGVEDPDFRKKNGKDPVGTIILSAEHEGNNITISIEDDGKGIDAEVLKEKAVSKGLITEEKARELSKKDAYNLIFLPGFSTAAKVTNVSGRGVGMDVVKTNVTKLRGIIDVESEVGKGSKIIIKLPLTLAIIPGMIVKVANEIVVIPLNSVVEVVRVHKDHISSINQRQVITLREQVLPLIDIDTLLYGVVEKKESDWQYVVVVGIAERRYGIKVDDLVGQKEVVIKSLGSYLGTVHGIAGSTILGDGTVVMILDISELINSIAK
ncbi:MAG: chemotaxis protein CheA [Bacteroidetes bacterium]|nr:chemotaxis protein CheA [Bacteroidota bacterium]